MTIARGCNVSVGRGKKNLIELFIGFNPKIREHPTVFGIFEKCRIVPSKLIFCFVFPQRNRSFKAVHHKKIVKNRKIGKMRFKTPSNHFLQV